MTLRLSSLAALVAAALFAVPTAGAQGQIDRNHVPSRERVSLFERRQTNLDANNLRTTIFNFGQSGRTGAVAGEIPYEWPKNTRRNYIALTGFFAGAEVTGESGNREYIVDLPNYRTNPDNPNQSWTWSPVSGYVNTRSEGLGIARSDIPGSWPAFWPDKVQDTTDPGWVGSWSGLFGKNVFNADLEVFYKIGDDQYARPSRNTYYPDSTDRSRRGLGLIASTRVLAWSQVLIQDVAFILHSVKNDGSKDLSTVGVTLWLADLVGGDADSSDDRPFFDLLLDTAFLTDADGRSSDLAFGTAQVEGAIAFFLESPGNATNRIDDDGDGSTAATAAPLNDYGVSTGEPGGPVISPAFLAGEGDQTGTAGQRLRFDGIDNNGNGLVDEDSSRAAFGLQTGVGFADYIDNDGDAEAGSPVVTAEMVATAAPDRWRRWPVNPAVTSADRVHLIQVGTEDVGRGFRDGIDNDGDGLRTTPPSDYLFETGSPVVTAAMVAAAAADAPYYRFRVPGTAVVLYDVKAEDVGKPYADGRDNDADGAFDEGIDENIDEMIDERRDDGIDNDGDWRRTLDDVGLDGADLTNDRGERDGIPTSGAGTGLPGEPNIDVTDTSESDQIGITNVQYKPAGGVNYQTVRDDGLFFDFMVPGQFTLIRPGAPLPPGTGQDNDLFVSSGTFPLRAGQTESVSFAVIMGRVDYGAAATNVPLRYRDLLTKRQNAQQAYDADYRFAQAPICPTVRAVPGDGTVTLYWDDAAERSFDTFIADLDVPGLNPRDFEGYRVYRSTDPGFLDSRQITDGFGNVSFLRPVAQYDLIDGIGGFAATAVNGTQYYLGTDTQDAGEAANGLANVYRDSSAVNGVTYYYAVTSYDFGAAPANIPPTECSVAITVGPDGRVTRTGPNVAIVTPSQRAAGYRQDSVAVEHTRGFATGRVGYTIVDPTALQDGHRYRVTFRDTLALGAVNGSGRQISQDTIRTRDVSLVDLTDGSVGFTNSFAWTPRLDAPITEGFQLDFDPVLLTAINTALTRWADPAQRPLVAQRFSFPNNFPGTRVPADYRVVVGPPGFGTTAPFTINFGVNLAIPAKPVNVRIFKTVVGADGQPAEVPVAFAFLDVTGPGADAFGPGTAATNLFSADPNALGAGQPDTDLLIVLEDIPGDRNAGLTPTWQFGLDLAGTARNPQEGDVGRLVTTKPFLATDIYEFTVAGPRLDTEAAQSALGDVRVVPNPYRGASAFEVANPFPTGRGERQIRFVNLPPRATIRIFTVSGRLVKTLELNEGTNEGFTAGQLLGGSLPWDLLNEDRLEVAYGMYLYHVEAPNVGETTGTFALIK